MALDGKTYALPFRYDNNLIFYNKDLFDAGQAVEYPKDGMTMAEVTMRWRPRWTSGEGNEKVYRSPFPHLAQQYYEFPDRTEEFKHV